MHISEGVLSPAALAAGWAVAGMGTAVGLRRLEPERTVRVALLSSAFFLASLINVRVGPGSTHLALIAPVGLVLGWAAFPAILTALLLQAMLFHFGGLLVLVPNTADMAVPAVAVYLLFSGPLCRARTSGAAAALSFFAGALAVLLGALGVGLFLGLSDGNLLDAAKVLFAAHVPLALIEGAVTAFMVTWLRRAAPDFLERSSGGQRPPETPS
ncbi:MAG: cobalt transporter CbiM [Fretibacterium sp.]|nr:cobalt transporter CbiM [Fretibacterium sp.]